jgi:AcrR family transcriptional regulator
MSITETSQNTKHVRLTRAQAKEQTREHLLEAAERVFVEKGFHAATLDQVAEDAGYTKGAVYSAFESKADLFLAIFAERSRRRAEEFSALALHARSIADLDPAGVDRSIQTMREEREWSMLLVEFEVHAARDPALCERLAGIQRALRSSMGEAIRVAVAASGEGMVVPAEQLMVAIVALSNGFVLEGMTGASADAPEAFREAVEWLVRGALASGDLP